MASEMAYLRAETPASASAKDADDLFVGKMFLHGNVLMWFMKTLLTSVCINQHGACLLTNSLK